MSSTIPPEFSSAFSNNNFFFSIKSFFPSGSSLELKKFFLNFVNNSKIFFESVLYILVNSFLSNFLFSISSSKKFSCSSD